MPMANKPNPLEYEYIDCFSQEKIRFSYRLYLNLMFYIVNNTIKRIRLLFPAFLW
jgi:hypothetical protein